MSIDPIQAKHAAAPVQIQDPAERAWAQALHKPKHAAADAGKAKFNKLIGEKSVDLMIQVAMTRTQPQMKGIDDEE